VVAGQTVRSIDFRPSTGVLYAVSTVSNGTAGQLYTVNLTTGVLTPVGAGFTLGAIPVPTQNPGVDLVEIEFNPVADVIRLLTGANLNGASNPVPNNYRLDPTTGALIATDTHLDYITGDTNGGNASMAIVAAAYANPAAGKTTLYAWDYSNDSQVRIGSIGGTPDSPNTGRMQTILRPAGFLSTGAGIGMDVGPSGTLYVTRDSSASTQMGLYSMNATTGAQTLIGNYPVGVAITDISVQRLTTAAGVTVSGRLLVSQGGFGDRLPGLANATVILTDTSGTSRTTTSGREGAFAFDDVEVGRTYTLTVRSRGYSFAPQVISVMDSISNISLNGTSAARDR